MNKYPNLLEMLKYYPCGEPAVCDHAGIEPELLHAALNGDEPLTLDEIMGISRLYGCPVSMIGCHKVIMLDMGRWRHKKLVAEVDNLYIRLKCMAGEGNQEAEKYMKLAGWKQQRFLKAARENRLSYGHYLGMKEWLTQFIEFAALRPKRRGLISA